jgi:hypothetical protein
MFYCPHYQHGKHTIILILSRVSLAQISPKEVNASKQPNPYSTNSWGFTSNKSKTCRATSNQSQHEYTYNLKNNINTTITNQLSNLAKRDLSSKMNDTLNQTMNSKIKT